jgi:predicted DNA-binding transcriptional regulator AlpA
VKAKQNHLFNARATFRKYGAVTMDWSPGTFGRTPAIARAILREDAMPSVSQTCPQLIYSIEDVQHVTSLGKTSIYKFIGEGALKTIKIGRRTGVRAEDLNAFISSLAEASKATQVA